MDLGEEDRTPWPCAWIQVQSQGARNCDLLKGSARKDVTLPAPMSINHGPSSNELIRAWDCLQFPGVAVLRTKDSPVAVESRKMRPESSGPH